MLHQFQPTQHQFQIENGIIYKQLMSGISTRSRGHTTSRERWTYLLRKILLIHYIMWSGISNHIMVTSQSDALEVSDRFYKLQYYFLNLTDGTRSITTANDIEDVPPSHPAGLADWVHFFYTLLRLNLELKTWGILMQGRGQPKHRWAQNLVNQHSLYSCTVHFGCPKTDPQQGFLARGPFRARFWAHLEVVKGETSVGCSPCTRFWTYLSFGCPPCTMTPDFLSCWYVFPFYKKSPPLFALQT